jgi:hypothetical protein
MDIAWNGILTCDYERTRPQGSPLEWELYTRSLTAWPAVFLGSPTPYGTVRRPGIVDIPEADHSQLVGQLHERLAQPGHARGLADRAAEQRRDASGALERVECFLPGAGPVTADLAAATGAILIVMSAHIVNWLLPEDQWETRMAKLLGNRADARACIAALSIPARAGHLLTQLTRSAAADAPGTGPGQIRQARTDTADRRDRWLTAAILAAAGDAPALDAVRAMVITLEWAAESEERRRDLRERYLALAATWCARTDLDMQSVTIADISTRAGDP